MLKFGKLSLTLREATATLTNRLTNTVVPWTDIHGLMANKLIAIDKKPGVRPIGIGEALRRLIAKAVLLETKEEAQIACGTIQTCTGLPGGVEATIHTARQIHTENKHKGWGILLVDSSNAFNCLNRSSTLWNTRMLWPKAATFIYNTYRHDSDLIIPGEEQTLSSQEGVTQGDPMAMPLYAIGTLPLIHQLEHTGVKQFWYADDASGCGPLEDLRRWFDKLSLSGPRYGYHPNPAKSQLVVAENMVETAKELFKDLNVNVTTCHELLGSYIGDEEAVRLKLGEKIHHWSEMVDRLSDVASTHPQHALLALTRGLKGFWDFTLRTTPIETHMFEQLEQSIDQNFIKNLLGESPSEDERTLFKPPTRLGGLGLPHPTAHCEREYETSVQLAEPLIAALVGERTYQKKEHQQLNRKIREESKKKRDTQDTETYNTVIAALSQETVRCVERAKDFKISGWMFTTSRDVNR
eukprot:GHVR01013979.1.p1 GENE.GHVR01013979.1~~GHVR01013979.1.p1  ORF type:complete len:467 (+),score=48.41 GHVR01013979.1:1308-2708(+)